MTSDHDRDPIGYWGPPSQTGNQSHFTKRDRTNRLNTEVEWKTKNFLIGRGGRSVPECVLAGTGQVTYGHGSHPCQMSSSPGQQQHVPAIPNPTALIAFGIESHTKLERLSGGRGIAYRAGNVVLKRLDMSFEMLEWLANTFKTIDIDHLRNPAERRIRLCKPLFGHLEDGSRSLVVENWTAWNWLDGISSETLGPLFEAVRNQTTDVMRYDPTLTYKWDHIIAAGQCFAALMQKHQVTKPLFLEARRDPWGFADQIAWSELSLEKETVIEVHVDNKIRPVSVGTHWRTKADYLGEALDIFHFLDQDPSSVHDEPSQIIHGDLAGNILFCLPLTDTSPPGIIDISPYFRPPFYSTAIVLVDALACENAPVEWAITYLKNKQQIKMFARALIFRVVSDYLLVVAGDVEAGDDYTCPMNVLRTMVEY